MDVHAKIGSVSLQQLVNQFNTLDTAQSRLAYIDPQRPISGDNLLNVLRANDGTNAKVAQVFNLLSKFVSNADGTVVDCLTLASFADFLHCTLFPHHTVRTFA